MARVEGTCTCTGCDNCATKTKVGWVDALSHLCRHCESTHAKTINLRWGAKGKKDPQPDPETPSPTA